MKYIMMLLTIAKGDTESQMLIPVIFPKYINHNDMARQTQRALRAAYPLGHYNMSTSEPVSAGFYSLSVQLCHGRSETLNLDSHPEDTEIISSYHYTHGLISERIK